MKTLFIIIDGLGDRPIPKLGNKTPLESAKTPNLDFFAKNGICGLIQPFQFSWQKYPTSDISHLALFGYNPKIYYLGRGPYEAVGVGIKLKAGDIALRANFATVDPEGVAPRPYGASGNLKVIDRRAGRVEKTHSLVKALNGITTLGVKFLIKKSFGHRAVLILRGKNLSEKITDSDPHEVGKRVKKVLPKNKSKEATFTAKVLNEFLEKAHLILKNHPLNKKKRLPANYLLVRGAGKFKKIPSFYQKYKLRAACVARGALYKGLGEILGMKFVKAKGATEFLNTNLKGKFETAKKTLKKTDFVFLHIKAADTLGEDGNFYGKKAFLEKFDKNLKIFRNLKNVLIVITGDHSTCSMLKSHCKNPVPIVMYGKKKNGVEKFGERACQKGGLGKIKGLDVMPKILALAKR